MVPSQVDPEYSHQDEPTYFLLIPLNHPKSKRYTHHLGMLELERIRLGAFIVGLQITTTEKTCRSSQKSPAYQQEYFITNKKILASAPVPSDPLLIIPERSLFLILETALT